MAGHSNARTTGLYDQRNDDISVGGARYFEAFDSYFPAEGIAPELWDLPRFVEEVEQVRQALALDRNNLYLFGQSWGGILALEYALKYQQNLKGLIVSNMVASIPAYNAYATKMLMPTMDRKALAEIQRLEAAREYENPRYEELLVKDYYEKHILRMPAEQWPDPVQRTFAKLNKKIYVPMQGPSEMGVSGKLAQWDRTADLSRGSSPKSVINVEVSSMQ